MYTLDFETIQQVMQEHQKTGFLFADLPSGVVGLRDSCRVEIKIMAGAVVSCAIIGQSGRRLTGKEAAQGLSRLDRLRWTFTPQQETPTQPTPAVLPPREVPVFPRRYVVYLDQQQMRTWSRMHRAVFSLADGTKSVAKIAEMLSTSPDIVDKVLRELQSIGVIILEPQSRKNHMDRSW
jgi:biotin operon repressor